MNIPQQEKIWGSVRHLFDTQQFAVSVLDVKKGGYSSRHFHKFRVNRFMVHSGRIAVVHYDGALEKHYSLNPGDVHDVPVGVVHRFEVIESGIVIEVYWNAEGARLDDITRLDVGGMLP